MKLKNKIIMNTKQHINTYVFGLALILSLLSSPVLKADIDGEAPKDGGYHETGAMGSIQITNEAIIHSKDGSGNNVFTETFEIRLAKAANKCWELQEGNTANKTPIELFECSGTDRQQWIIDEQQYIRPVKDPTKCVGPKRGNRYEGATIELVDCEDEEFLMWEYDPVTQTFQPGDDFEKCLQVEDGSTENGTSLELSDCDGSNDQKWLIE